MTAPASHRFHLVGPQEGQTISLGGHAFVEGVYEFIYVVDGVPVLPSNEDVTLKARSLARNYQAFPENSAELDAARAAYAAIAKGKEPEAPIPGGGELDVTEREDADQEARSEAVLTSRKEKTLARDALLQLKHDNDEHWTDAGLPSVAAVRAIAGIDTISRADITALAPNLNREEAAKVAANPAG